MDRISIRAVTNGFTVEVNEYTSDEEFTYIYSTVDELKAAIAGHIDEAIALSAKAKAEKLAKEAAKTV